MTQNKHQEDFFKRVYEVVAQIPEGKVTTYGAIARHLGTGGSARLVGWALNKTAASPPGASNPRAGSMNRDPDNNRVMGENHARDDKNAGANENARDESTINDERSGRGENRNSNTRSFAPEMLPCHRVVNRKGELTGKAWFGGELMEQLLRSEGVGFDEYGRVDMDRHFWEP